MYVHTYVYVRDTDRVEKYKKYVYKRITRKEFILYSSQLRNIRVDNSVMLSRWIAARSRRYLEDVAKRRVQRDVEEERRDVRVSLARYTRVASRRFYFSHERRAFESDLAPCSAGSAKKEEKEWEGAKGTKRERETRWEKGEKAE